VKKFLIFSASVFALLCVSCASNKDFGKTDFMGMVIDGNNRPVVAYTVQSGSSRAVSNFAGRFTLSNVKSSTVVLHGSGKGYMNFDAELNQTDCSQVFCIQVQSWEQALEEAERLALAGNLTAAEEKLNLIEKSACDSKRLSYDKKRIEEMKNAEQNEPQSLKESD